MQGEDAMPHNMSRRCFLDGISAITASFALSSCGGGLVKMSRKPNIVFILIDDLGWADVGCYGSELYETPNIDRLAAEGMRFTDAYAACPVCSPTRASILTGKYPARLHLTDWIAGYNPPKAKLKRPDWTMYLDTSETTISEALKPAGYVSASIGKWHLGGEAYYPEKQGFDCNVAGYDAGQPPTYYYPYTVDRAWNASIPTLEGGRDGEYLTDRLTDEALKFIESNSAQPFFLYLAHYAVHTPIEAKSDYVPHFRDKIKPGMRQKNPDYAAMIQSVDESVGRIMDKIAELKLDNDTVIIFMSDNGGLSGIGDWLDITSNHPLREGKGTAYEGGIREPMIVRWPGVVKPGTVSDIPVTSVDFFPTFCGIAGVGNSNTDVDGLSILPLLTGSGGIDREAIYWHYPHYHLTTPFSAVRKGDFKLIEYYEDGRLELYNLKSDVGEEHNLVDTMPEKAAELKKLLRDWLESVDAQMPSENPDYDGRPYDIRNL